MSLIRHAVAGVIKQHEALQGAEYDEILVACIYLQLHRELDPPFRSEMEAMMGEHIGYREYMVACVLWGYGPKNPDGSRHFSGCHLTGHRVSTAAVFARMRNFAIL